MHILWLFVLLLGYPADRSKPHSLLEPKFAQTCPEHTQAEYQLAGIADEYEMLRQDEADMLVELAALQDEKIVGIIQPHLGRQLKMVDEIRKKKREYLEGR